jgi:flavodoxin I
MKVLAVYATNSGGTAQAVDVTARILREAGCEVEVKGPSGVSPDTFAEYDCILLASPSWDYADKEGQPHEDFMPLLNSMNGKTFENRPFAILGLGDSSYTHFCGAADVFEQLIGSVKGKLIIPSLRIDRFYQKPENIGLVETWAQGLAKALSS